jgi:Flp pilus assembly pilin Flp
MLQTIEGAIVRLVASLQREEGQTLSEYGLILALVAVAAVVALGVLAAAITGTLGSVASSLTGATSGS